MATVKQQAQAAMQRLLRETQTSKALLAEEANKVCSVVLSNLLQLIDCNVPMHLGAPISHLPRSKLTT